MSLDPFNLPDLPAAGPDRGRPFRWWQVALSLALPAATAVAAVVLLAWGR
jgi:hypothetical protein